MRGQPPPRLVLASASPRRRELLARLGMSFEVAVPDVDEGVPSGRAERAARQAASVKARGGAALNSDAVVLAADTVVADRGRLLGKPGDAAEAGSMLRRLGGRSHRVATAVAVVPPARTGARRGGRRRPLVDHAVTRVAMRVYGDDEIAASIRRADPFDKAGAYAIQDELLRPVERYEGCYCNVVGLPLWTAARLLMGAGLDIAVDSARLLPHCGACPLAGIE